MATMRPFVNINGTAREELVEQRRSLLEAILDAKAALAKSLPHGRDYIGDPARFDHDRGVFNARYTALDDLYNEVLEEALQIQRQGEEA